MKRFVSDRAKVQGFVLSGITAGSVIAMPLGSWIVQTWGWPAIFYVFGLSGLLWIGPWLRYASALQSKSTHLPTRRGERIPWRIFLTHRSTLGLTLSYYCHNYASYFILAWLPTYLIKVHGFSMTGMGIGAALPALAATIGMNVSGLYTDHLIARVLSFIPTFTPFLMINRIASAQPPGTMEIVLSVVVLMAAIVVTVWLAARVFRVGVLLYGKPPGFREVIRWMREA